MDLLPGEKRILDQQGYSLTNRRVLQRHSSDMRSIFLTDISFVGCMTIRNPLFRNVAGVMFVLALVFFFMDNVQAGAIALIIGAVFIILYLLAVERPLQIVSHGGSKIEWFAKGSAEEVFDSINAAKAALAEGRDIESQATPTPPNLDVKGNLGF